MICLCAGSWQCNNCAKSEKLGRPVDTNPEGLTWPEWYAAATLSVSCCNPNAWGACTRQCPRVHSDKAPAAMGQAWNEGVDPTDWHANNVPTDNGPWPDRDVAMCGVVYRRQPDGSFMHSGPETK